MKEYKKLLLLLALAVGTAQLIESAHNPEHTLEDVLEELERELPVRQATVVHV